MNWKVIQILALALIASISWAGDSKEEKIKQMIKAKDVPISFYGRVLDQNGNAVVDAQVTMQIGYFDPTVLFYFKGIKKISVYTDSSGYFELTNQIGDDVLIAKIEKKGYEFIYESPDNTGFDYSADLAKDRFIPDPANPVVFKMRKKEPATLVFKHGYRFSIDPKGEETEIDLTKFSWAKKGVLGTNYWDKGAHTDLRIKAKLSDDKTNYAITFTTPDDNSGIVEREELLYVVPEEGYQPSKIITIVVGSSVKKHLYIKSRKGNVYARLDIEISTGVERVSVDMMSWVNPNGGRNVDYDEDQEIEYTRRKNEEDRLKIIEREERKRLKEQKQ